MEYSNNVVRKRRPVRKKRKVKRKTENSTLYIGLIGFILISVYLFGCVYKFATQQPISVEEVQYGSIEVPKIYDGVIIRDEQIITSLAEGEINYYYSEGEKVKKDSVVCIVKDIKTSKILEETIENYDSEIMNIQKNRSDISLIQDDINRINSNIENIASNYIIGKLENRLDNLYFFKNQIYGEIELRNRQLLFENRGSVKGLVEEKFIAEEQLKKITTAISTPESGIVSFSMDKAEDMYSVEKMELLTPKETSMKIEEAERINSENVKIDEPVFKIINGNEWYVAAYIPDYICRDWEINNTKKLTFKDDKNNSLNFKIKSITQGDGEKLIIFYSDRSIVDYINTRSIRFEVEAKVHKGLKVPNTAIIEKTFLKIPMDYVIENSGQYSVIKIKEVADEEIPIKIAFKDETLSYAYILQDFNNVKVGDKLLMKNNNEREEYIINDAIASPGVYVVNRGTAELKTIEVISNNETHSIVNAIGETSVRVYDKIVSDAKNITEGQLVY